MQGYLRSDRFVFAWGNPLVSDSAALIPTVAAFYRWCKDQSLRLVWCCVDGRMEKVLGGKGSQFGFSTVSCISEDVVDPKQVVDIVDSVGGGSTIKDLKKNLRRAERAHVVVREVKHGEWTDDQKRAVEEGLPSKTPPPAPSAAFAKRACEMQGNGMIGRYRPPALCTLTSGSSPPNVFTFDHQHDGFRGQLGFAYQFLPCEVQIGESGDLALQHVAHGAAMQMQVCDAECGDHGSGADAAKPLPLCFSPSLVASSALTKCNSRLRSGSLTTLPSDGLQCIQPQQLLVLLAVVQQQQRISSARRAVLYESHHRLPPAVMISELHNQTQAVITGNLSNPPHMCTMMVSHPYRQMPMLTGLLLSTLNAEEEEDIVEQSYGHQSLDAHIVFYPDKESNELYQYCNSSQPHRNVLLFSNAAIEKHIIAIESEISGKHIIIEHLERRLEYAKQKDEEDIEVEQNQVLIMENTTFISP
ncbi:hypothetical protein EW146_g4454 [Bondarzewia mesenterica]|uniref:Uncharacterized protein n=1 Tax=Bondarzewia mesenterica TaxID=1095465 RepID=A0A4V3XF48_9AGAM|nr:hypothetical protein EW146_g4454 [Bondarzewia mesenterica]